MLNFDLENLQFALLCFSSLFTLINPIGILPIYLTMTQNLSRLERTQINKQGLISAGMILLLFAFVGDYIFSIYDVTIEAFKIAGGIIFFRIGLTNLESNLRIKYLLINIYLRIKQGIIFKKLLQTQF